jgi:hypothetical protein
MSFMFEVYYRPPTDARREAALTERVANLGGRLTFREAAEDGRRGVCLTYEFDGQLQAETAAAALRAQGEHVEGPVDYGSDPAEPVATS